MALTFQDKQEIYELFARYSHAIDAGEADALAGTFTPTGSFDGPGGMHVGTAQLRQMAIDYHEHPDINNTQHLTNSILAEGDGDAANAVCYAMCVSPTVDGTAIRIELINRYEDELRRVDGKWLFHRRVVKDVFPEAINDFSLDAAE